MIITKITPQVKNLERVNLFVDDKFFRSLDRILAIKWGLKPGLVLTPDLLKKLEKDQQNFTAWEYALKLLKFGPKSIKGMRDKLKSKYEPELVESTVRKLIAEGFLDDFRVAEQIVERFVNSPSKSVTEIRYYLKTKGLEDEAIKEALANFEDDYNLEAAKSLIRHKARQMKTGDPKAARLKISQYLARKGFSYPVVKKALDSLDGDVE